MVAVDHRWRFKFQIYSAWFLFSFPLACLLSWNRKNQKESIVLSGFLRFCVVTAKIIGEDIALFFLRNSFHYQQRKKTIGAFLLVFVCFRMDSPRQNWCRESCRVSAYNTGRYNSHPAPHSLSRCSPATLHCGNLLCFFFFPEVGLSSAVLCASTCGTTFLPHQKEAQIPF